MEDEEIQEIGMPEDIANIIDSKQSASLWWSLLAILMKLNPKKFYQPPKGETSIILYLIFGPIWFSIATVIWIIFFSFSFPICLCLEYFPKRSIFRKLLRAEAFLTEKLIAHKAIVTFNQKVQAFKMIPQGEQQGFIEFSPEQKESMFRALQKTREKIMFGLETLRRQEEQLRFEKARRQWLADFERLALGQVEEARQLAPGSATRQNDIQAMQIVQEADFRTAFQEALQELSAP